MKLKCDGCGNWHTVSPTALVMIVNAFQRGDLQRMTGKGVTQLCLGDALNPETLAQQRMDSKTVVNFDKQRYVGKQVA